MAGCSGSWRGYPLYRASWSWGSCRWRGLSVRCGYWRPAGRKRLMPRLHPSEVPPGMQQAEQGPTCAQDHARTYDPKHLASSRSITRE